MTWRVAAIALGILLLLASLPAIRHLRESPPPPPPPPPVVRLSLAAPAGAELGAADEVLDAAISPDSREIVFVATSSGAPRLWRRKLDLDRADPLPGTDGAALPVWHPDGRLIAFFAGGKLKQLALAEGTVRDLADAPAPAGAAWLGDGSLVFVPDARGPVRRLRDGATTDASALQPGDRGHAFPVPLDADGFLYVATLDDGRRVARLGGASSTNDLTATSSHAALVGDHLLHVRDGTLLAQRFDRERVAVTGRAVPLAFDVGVAPGGHGFFAVSPRLLAWAPAATRARELVWFDFEGRRLGTAAEPADYSQVRLSPDDREAAATMLHPMLRSLDVFVLSMTASAPPERLTVALAADSNPVWAPGGDRVLFRSLLDGQPNLFVRRVHAPAAEPEALLRSELDETPSDWRDRTVLFHAPGSDGFDVWALDLATGARTAVARYPFNERDARWSPDGRRIAYASDESGRAEIYVEPWVGTAANERGPGLPAEAAQQRGPGLPAEAAQQRRRVSFGGGAQPQWSRDGRTLFFLREGRLTRADALDDGRFAVPRPVLEGAELHDYDVAHRSDRILAIVSLIRSERPVAGVIVDWRTAVR